MTWRASILLTLFLGSLCIQLELVKSEPVSKEERRDNIKSSGIKNTESGTDMQNIDFVPKAFSYVLKNQLKDSDILTSLFSNPVDGDLIVNMASSIADLLVLKVGLVDSHSTANLITEALLSVAPGVRSEEYCSKLTNVTQKILLNNKILNSENYFTLANIVSQIIVNSASEILNDRNRTSRRNRNSFDTANGLGIDIANLDVNADVNSLLGTQKNTDFFLGNNLDSNVDLGTKIDLSVSEEAILQFKSKLANELLLDRSFRYVFSDYVPSNALKQISGAVCQYISKAFAISRTFLLPLENSIKNLSLDSAPSPEVYASMVTSTLTDLFSKINFITQGTASLQATIAANAITSGIASFIRMSTIPGIGFSIMRDGENSFNSYFSVLNGLEKLPYVGIEASSLKLPTVLKLTYASIYASHFAKALFYNLAPYNDVLETFCLGVPTYVNKIIAKCLGSFVAEAFGSPNPKLFYDLYYESLLTSAANLNSINYVKAISFATARALFLNGYFLSGNINVQAAIAKNAIIQALTNKIKPITNKVVIFPSVLGLSWMTQVNGVLPSQMLLKYGIGAMLNKGVDAAIKLRLNKIMNARENEALGAGMNVNAGLESKMDTNTGLGAAVGINTGLGAGLDINSGLGTVLGANIGARAGLGGNTGLEAEIIDNSGLRAGFGGNIGLGTGLDLNGGLGIESLNTNLGTGIGVGAGLAKLGQNAALGGLGMNAGLEEKLFGNAGLRTGLGVNAGLGAGSNSNIGLGAGLGSNMDFGAVTGHNGGFRTPFGINQGIGANLGLNAGLAGGMNAKSGLARGLNVNTGFGTNLGDNAFSRAGLSQNAGLGAGLNAYGGLKMNDGLRGSFDADANKALKFQGFNIGREKASTREKETDLGLNAGIKLDGGTKGALRIEDNAQVRQNSRKKREASADALKSIPDTDLNRRSFTKSKPTEKSDSSKKEQKNIPSETKIDTDVNTSGGSKTKVGTNALLGIGANEILGEGLKPRIGANADLGVDTAANLGLNADASLGAETKARLINDIGKRSYIGANFGLRPGVGKSLDFGSNQDTAARLGSSVNLGQLQTTVTRDSSNTRLSVLNVLPLILSNKLYQSTALHTSISMVGANKVIDLIAQAMASQFGLPIATIFLRSYEQHTANKVDNTFEINTIGIAEATAEALAATGILNSEFLISTVEQLSDAIVIKYSSLIATSLEAKVSVRKPQWKNQLSQDLFQPRPIPEYITFK